MNANELANNQLTHVIGNNYAGEEVVITLRKPLYPESFVRQQQAEIEALKRPNNVVGVPQDKLAEMQSTIRQQQAEIEALKLCCPKCGGVTGILKVLNHPVKELTDAEIWSISAKHGDLSWHDHTLNFARAILRKASEK